MIQEKWFGIGEVVANLKREYDKLTKSMVRFWEKEGLISPTRTEGGHRKYSQQDVFRMRIIAELRQNRYLPISVVKRIVKRLDQDPSYELDMVEEELRPGSFPAVFQPIAREQAASRTGLTMDQISEIEQLGFLPGHRQEDPEQLFDRADMEILRFINDMVGAGFAIADLGFYVEDTKRHIKHETALWERLSGGGTADQKEHKRALISKANRFRQLIYLKYGGLTNRSPGTKAQ